MTVLNILALPRRPVPLAVPPRVPHPAVPGADVMRWLQCSKHWLVVLYVEDYTTHLLHGDCNKPI